MSWLSDFFTHLFGQLFGQQSIHTAARYATKNAPHHAEVKTSKKASTIQHTATKHQYREQTLGFLLQHSPSLMPDIDHYDLNNPPLLSNDVCAHLKAGIHQIPAMPEIWHQVQDILQQADASASDLGQCVAQDPVLTAQILKVCNSSAYATAKSAEVNNIPLAIARLGLDEASSIIFQTLAPDLGGSEQRKKEIRHIWFHAQAIAMLSRILAEPSTLTSRNTATLNAMLHDIGKLVILHIASDQQLDDLKNNIAQGKASLTAEHHILGYTHIDAGMMLALHWKLPKQIQNAISLHHHPCMIKADQLPQAAQHAMLILHTAHLILQSQATDHFDVEKASIWQSHQRTCLHDSLRFAQHDMLIPLASDNFYRQIQTDIIRLQQSFPDLFKVK